jgi:valyl-tRNA synthetase
MEKIYDPKTLEARWQKFWQEQGFFSPEAKAPAYCIMIPPPNVTGTLHMGHAFQYTLMDILIRKNRMQGKNTLWQPGTDHAGIATQMVVERQLAQAGKSRHDLGRENFVARVWDWKAESGGKITEQTRRLGASVDWQRERFTLDDGLSKAVSKVFVELYRQDLLYRGQRLVNWDPVLHTALSDLEVIAEAENGQMWHLRYPLAESKEYLIVATTRPETLLGDMAVAVHPEDERYQKFIGKMVKLPLTDREIPVIADTYVDPAFGSGCVKITPAHDFNDYEVGKRHHLPLLNIFTAEAKLNENTPVAYQGLDRYVARKKIIADLQALNLLEKIEAHTLMVPRGDRSGVVVEPFLTDQWYVRAAPLAEKAIAAVKNGQTRFVPENWQKTYFDWLENIQDWCISRQLWWGHRIPAWYDGQGQVYVGYDEAEVRQYYQLPADLPLHQDEDVLDTWFSSALWPFSTLGWPEQTPELEVFYPTDVLVTGFDIIFFWVARMMMLGLHFVGAVPFRTVYVHGLVRDAHGEKMSKSKGNVLDPIDLIDGIDLESLVKKRTSGLMQPQLAPKIEKTTRADYPDGLPAFGTDALRLTFAALATQGRDVRFDIKRIEGYRNFCNKLWNASRYVWMQLENQEVGKHPSTDRIDGWIVHELQSCEAEVATHLDAYRFDLAMQSIYDFTWNSYCDWYLELSKVLLQQGDNEQKAATRRTLVRVLEALLRLIHPFAPFISEEIWQKMAPLAGINLQATPSICIANYPEAEPSKLNPAAKADVEWLKSVISSVRNIRSEMNIAPSKRIPLLLQDISEDEKNKLVAFRPFIEALAKVDKIEILERNSSAPEAALALVGDLRLLIPLAELIDKEAELKRLQKQSEKLQGEYDKLALKLSNAAFTDKAPADLVAKEQARLQELQAALLQLAEQKQKIETLSPST